MKTYNLLQKRLPVLFLIGLLAACSTPAPEKDPPLTVRQDPATGAATAKEIKDNTAYQLAEGLTLDLWATDSLAPDPIAMSIDDEGRVYLTRTNRQKNSEFDIRGHRDWMTRSIGLQSVEDRRAFLKDIFAPEKSAENEWLKDLNNDGSHDWKDLAVEQDEVWRIEDEDGDGLADVSTRILSDFNEEITDVAGALLVREKDMFVGIGPDMWRLQDTDGDGLPDEKVSISHGYAVHIGFSGHGMSGVIEGPDGKIYWGIGDIGANITAPDGIVHKYPNQGVIVRSNPDGSDFEVYAAGVRNTHEFVFDEYGNLISSDNDGDHRGESERLVHIVEGSDAGWRANWQYGKYTDPKNNSYKVWMDEELFKPRWEGQAAYIIPPIINYHNGPTGMVYNPGTALGSDWKNNFFLVEFVGNPSRSHIWSFTLKPKGASFDLAQEKDVISGVLPTGLRFGPDGALYFADWVNGWDTKNYGRVWKIDVADEKNDLKALREETKKRIQMDYSSQPEDELLKLLAYGDMRIRQKAQFELVARGKADVLLKAIAQRDNQLARIHGIWGIGQLAAQSAAAAAPLADLLTDEDAEIVAQAVKVIGDVKYAEAGEALIPLLAQDNPRVKFFAAQALGRIKYAKAVQPIINMIDANNDEDVYLRHAGVLALSRIGQEAPITALAESEERDLRIAAVLVLRRMQSEKVALFLNDKDEYIVTEAARAINDDWSIEGALPALAATLQETRFSGEPLIRRAINAALRVGGENELNLLMSYALRNTAPASLRAEALATLGTWANPSVMDRVDGRYRGAIERDPALVTAKVKENINKFLTNRQPEVLIATAQMLSQLGISDNNAALAGIMSKNSTPEVRSAMLVALQQLKHDGIEDAIKAGMSDRDATVRTTAVGLLASLNLSKEALPGIVGPVFSKGDLREQQQLLRVLGDLPVEQTESVLADLIDQMAGNKLSEGLVLDLTEAVEATKSEALIAQLSQISSGESIMEMYAGTLLGGDANRGGRYFYRNSTGQCVRCHSIGDNGGEVGPSLSNIGNILSREQLLQSLVEPSARLSPGFGTVTLTLTDGETVTGILIEETEEEITLKTTEAEPLEIAVSRISSRQNIPSSMPPMGGIMSKREIRDMIEFLSGQKE